MSNFKYNVVVRRVSLRQCAQMQRSYQMQHLQFIIINNIIIIIFN